MKHPLGHRKFLSLARRFDGTDAQLASLLDVSPSMLSRIRGGKVQKIDRYLERLEMRFGEDTERFSDILADLGRWSEDSSELRAMLIALHRIAQGDA